MTERMYDFAASRFQRDGEHVHHNKQIIQYVDIGRSFFHEFLGSDLAAAGLLQRDALHVVVVAILNLGDVVDRFLVPAVTFLAISRLLSRSIDRSQPNRPVHEPLSVFS